MGNTTRFAELVHICRKGAAVAREKMDSDGSYIQWPLRVTNNLAERMFTRRLS